MARKFFVGGNWKMYVDAVPHPKLVKTPQELPTSPEGDTRELPG